MWTAIMVLGIVAMTQIARVARAKYNAQNGIVTDRKGRIQMLAQPADTELQREVETLRERIKVLERIATDGRQSNNLAAEIESLRDH
jgi:hypothetical protein